MEQSERPVCPEDAVDLHEVLHRDQRTVRVRVAVDAPRTAAPRRLRRVARPPSECEQCQLVRHQPVCDLSVPQYRICHRHTSSSSRSRSRASSSWFPAGSVIRCKHSLRVDMPTTGLTLLDTRSRVNPRRVARCRGARVDTCLWHLPFPVPLRKRIGPNPTARHPPARHRNSPRPIHLY